MGCHLSVFAAAGWICEKAAGNKTQQQPMEDALAFKVTLGAQVQLQVTYLTSWFSMAAANMAIYSGNLPLERLKKSKPLSTYTLNGATTERFTVPKTTVLVHTSAWQQWPSNLHALKLPAEATAASYIVVFAVSTPRGVNHTGKFKLLGLSAC
jgi:hypothetical protein